jgi:hypothetical protein
MLAVSLSTKPSLRHFNCLTSKSVLPIRYRLQMGRVDTPSVPTEMVDVKPGRNGPDPKLIGKPVP